MASPDNYIVDLSLNDDEPRSLSLSPSRPKIRCDDTKNVGCWRKLCRLQTTAQPRNAACCSSGRPDGYFWCELIVSLLRVFRHVFVFNANEDRNTGFLSPKTYGTRGFLEFLRA